MCIASLPHRQFQTFPDLQVDANASQRQGGPITLLDVVYQWSCTKPNCKSSYIGETSMSLCEYVKEHTKEGSNSAIYQHCSTKGHPLPNIDQFKVITPDEGFLLEVETSCNQ